MHGPPRSTPPTHAAGIHDARAIRAALAAVLAAGPPDEASLRQGVWMYVVSERDAGASPGHVILNVTSIVEAARIVSEDERRALTRRVILWCVEAYFGHLGGEVPGRDGLARSETPGRVP